MKTFAKVSKERSPVLILGNEWWNIRKNFCQPIQDKDRKEKEKNQSKKAYCKHFLDYTQTEK